MFVPEAFLKVLSSPILLSKLENISGKSIALSSLCSLNSSKRSAMVSSRYGYSSTMIAHSQFHLQESTEREVILHDDEPWIVARMIQFLYFGSFHDDRCQDSQTGISESYKPLCYTSLEKIMQNGQPSDTHGVLPRTECQRSEVESLALMYQIADKYDVASM